MDTLAADVRYAFRSLRQSPGFFCLVIGVLALGIAASVSVFSIVDGVLLRPLPYRNPERLVMLTAVNSRPPFDSNGSLSYADYQQLQSQAHSFESLAITYRTGWSSVILTGGPEPERVQGAFVSPNLFGLFGRSPLIGRAFTSGENQRGERVALIGESLAIGRFGSPAQALGQDLEIGPRKWRIVGVMPSAFRVPFLDTQLWMPILSHPEWNSGAESNPRELPRWDVMGRLREGTPLSSAQAEVDTIESRLKSALPEFHKDNVRVVPLREHFTGKLRRAFWVLFGAVAFLLLIACANSGNLLLARASTRSRELALRAALGAGSARLLRQLTAESVTYCSIAGLLGVCASLGLVVVLKAVAPPDTPRLSDVGIDVRALLFALALVLSIGLLLGLTSAWRVSRREPREFLNASGRAATENRGSRRVKGFLVASEFALAMVLLTGAALFIRSFAAVLEVPLGFRPEQVLTVRMSLPLGTTAAKATDFYNRALDKIGSIPGVQAAGGVSSLFFLDEKRTHALKQVEGHPAEPVASWKPLVWTQIGGSYFQAMGIPLLRGRYFNRHDTPDSPPVAIVNQALAQRYWPGESPIGKRLKGFDPRGKNDDWLTVIGLVGDSRSGGRERPPFSQIYEPQAQRGEQLGSLVIRTAANPVQAASTIRTLIHKTNRTAIISSIGTMERLLDRQTLQRRFQTWLIGVFSAIALALAALGVFAVMRYSVSSKTHEIGVRMAVGAQSGDILRLVLWDGARLSLTGTAAGALAAMWFNQAVAGMLYQVTPGDPVSFGAAAITLAAVAVIATYLPARQAARVDPAVALRRE